MACKIYPPETRQSAERCLRTRTRGSVSCLLQGVDPYACGPGGWRARPSLFTRLRTADHPCSPNGYPRTGGLSTWIFGQRWLAT
jgi:hypothetical protein